MLHLQVRLDSAEPQKREPLEGMSELNSFPNGGGPDIFMKAMDLGSSLASQASSDYPPLSVQAMTDFASQIIVSIHVALNFSEIARWLDCS